MFFQKISHTPLPTTSHPNALSPPPPSKADAAYTLAKKKLAQARVDVDWDLAYLEQEEIGKHDAELLTRVNDMYLQAKNNEKAAAKAVTAA